MLPTLDFVLLSFRKMVDKISIMLRHSFAVNCYGVSGKSNADFGTRNGLLLSNKYLKMWRWL